MKASIVTPFHSSGYVYTIENLRRTLASLRDQGEYSFLSVGFRPVTGLKYFRDTKSPVELLIVTDHATQFDTWGNKCAKANVGIKLAVGEVFVMLQQEIVAAPLSIQKMVDHVLKNPDDLIYATMYKQDCRSQDLTAPLYKGDPIHDSYADFFYACNRKKLIEIGGYDESFAYEWGKEDIEFLDRARKHFNFKVVDWAVGTHLWHPCAQGTSCEGNQAVFTEKMAIPDRIANEGKDWGVIS